ncbi:hypothetical protein JRO89_XS08G0053600 [Xanthoceras sorbifolium]|uniref:Uncharacterized protein n=1 Tax=Xanthoceras sorbifolium TaxID=99658 RepID=A0ABQ8HNQ0_9ROSI|nr:hypothetical protein JRO89_XS08G0053600 [Xanthoceras sorbifolium]
MKRVSIYVVLLLVLFFTLGNEMMVDAKTCERTFLRSTCEDDLCLTACQELFGHDPRVTGKCEGTNCKCTWPC